MGSAAAGAVLDVLTAAGMSLDFFDLDFIVFFGLALISLVFTLPCAIVFLVRGDPMKLSARRTASMRPSGAGCRANHAEAFGDAVCVDCDEFGTGAWGSGKAVLFCKHLLDSFCIGREAYVARR